MIRHFLFWLFGYRRVDMWCNVTYEWRGRVFNAGREHD